MILKHNICPMVTLSLTFLLPQMEQWRDRNGERQTRTEWHNVTLYGKLGKIANQYLRKGSQVFIEGRIQSRKYSGKDGIERIAYDNYRQ